MVSAGVLFRIRSRERITWRTHTDQGSVDEFIRQRMVVNTTIGTVTVFFPRQLDWDPPKLPVGTTTTVTGIVRNYSDAAAYCLECRRIFSPKFLESLWFWAHRTEHPAQPPYRLHRQKNHNSSPPRIVFLGGRLSPSCSLQVDMVDICGGRKNVVAPRRCSGDKRTRPRNNVTGYDRHVIKLIPRARSRDDNMKIAFFSYV